MNEIYTISMLLSIILFMISTHITPGPTNIMLLSSVTNFGYKKSMPFMIGCIVSYPLMLTLAGIGIGTYLVKYPFIMQILKVFGIFYIGWMAWSILKSNQEENFNEKEIEPLSFLHAFLYTVMNPKAWVVYTSAISIFITSPQYGVYQLIIIVIIAFLSMIVSVYVWSYGGVILKKFIHNSMVLKRINTIMAFLLVVSMAPIIL